MFEHIVHFTNLHIDWGATEIGITNGNTPDGRDHAGHTATSYRGTEFRDSEGNNLGGGCAGAHGGGVQCNTREDVGTDTNSNFEHFQHDGGSEINGYFHDFGHMHTDNVVGSDINQNDMGHDTHDATSGNASYGDADDINQGDWYMHSNYLKTDGFTGPYGTGDDFVAGGRGMFGDYAIHAPHWLDTTNMDNIRMGGGTETMPSGCHGSLANGNLSCYHSATQFTNNDTDNTHYWSSPGGTKIYAHQNYSNNDAPNHSGDNGWQRAGNGYTGGDFGAGSVAGNCNVGDTCTVSNTFTGSGYGTVNDAANVVSNNNGTWGSGSKSKGNASSNMSAHNSKSK